jgi:cysteine synthase
MLYKNILEVIGNTPLVRLPFTTPATIYAKLEYLNPTGSVKDRAALFMIEEAERKGILKPGGTIIEASSGNQGITTAMIGAIKGYRVIITVSEKISKEKRDTLQAYGAELVVCPATERLDDPNSYHRKALELHRAMPNSFMLNQYFNPDNAQAHYYSLGPEIWHQTKGKITHLIAAAGSGGTVTGAGKYLKEKNPAVKVIAVDAATSYRSTHGKPQPYKLEGLGVDYDTPLLDMNVIDDFVAVHDNDALAMLKTLARSYGFLVGPASGAVAYGVQEYTKSLPSDALIVTLFTDSGRAYLTKNFYS